MLRGKRVVLSPALREAARRHRTMIGEDCATESIGGRPVAPLMGRCTYDSIQTLAIVNPLTNLVLNPDYALVYTYTPRSAHETGVAATWFVKESADLSEPSRIADVTAVWEPTLLEDKGLVENVHLGLQSSAYRSGPWIEAEAFVRDFDHWYGRAVGAQAL